MMQVREVQCFPDYLLFKMDRMTQIRSLEYHEFIGSKHPAIAAIK
jgi:hypothetical protein